MSAGGCPAELRKRPHQNKENTMKIAHFDDLLTAARLQNEPQRLLLVFAGVELPDDCTPAQRAGFSAGHGGVMVPLMCVDKLPSELHDFAALLEESSHIEMCTDWRLVFAASLSGSPSRAPSSLEAESALERMIEAIQRGEHGQFIPFDRQGLPVMMH
jgi:hypothetical protein